MKICKWQDIIANNLAKNDELINSIKFSDEQNARITSDKVVSEELLKDVTTSFDFYKLYSYNEDFMEDFSPMMFGVVNDLIHKVINNTTGPR